MQGEVKGEVEQLREKRTCACREDGLTDSRHFSQVECDVSVRMTRQPKQRADLLVSHVGVRRVTVVIVHFGLEGVLVVVHLCVAILFVNCCIMRCTLYTYRIYSLCFLVKVIQFVPCSVAIEFDESKSFHSAKESLPQFHREQLIDPSKHQVPPIDLDELQILHICSPLLRRY